MKKGDEMKTYHYIIKGRVQGVFFRFHTKEEAQKLNIKGTVKNLFTGDVEVYAQGEPSDIVKFEQYLNRGPDTSLVESVTKEELEYDRIFSTFEVTY